MQDKLWNEYSAKEFFPAVNRETEGKYGPLPSKPSPEPILHICNIWGCLPGNVIMVGDCAADDIVAASRAGCGGRVLLKYNGEILDNDSGGGDAINDAEREEREPSLVVTTLGELLQILERN